MQTRSKILREWLKQKLPPALINLSMNVNKSNPKFAILESNQLDTTIVCSNLHITTYPNLTIIGGKPPGRGYRKIRSPKKLYCHTCMCNNRVYKYIMNILFSMLHLPFEVEYANKDRIRMSVIKRCFHSGLNISIVMKSKKNPQEDPLPPNYILIINNFSSEYGSLCEYLHALADELKQKILEIINRDPSKFHPWIIEDVTKYKYRYTFDCSQNTKIKKILGNFEESTSEYIYGDSDEESDDERVKIAPRL